MPHRFFRIIPFLIIASLPATLHAQDAAAPAAPVPWVSVSFEVNGLAETADLLNDAARQLSETLTEIAASPEDLTPEQLAAFGDLTRDMQALVAALDRTLQGLAPAIRSAEVPTREVLTGLIDTTRTLAIEPTIDSIDSRIRGWLVVTILGAVLLVGLAGFGFWLATRQLRGIVDVLRSISDEYELVPRRRPAETAPGVEVPDDLPGNETTNA